MIWFDWWQKLCWAGKPKKKQNSRRGVCLFLRPFFVWRSSPSLNRCWLPNKKLPFLKGRQNFRLGVTDLPKIEQKRKARHNPNCFAERVGQRKICLTFFYKSNFVLVRTGWKLSEADSVEKKMLSECISADFAFQPKLVSETERNRTEKFRLSRFFGSTKKEPGQSKNSFKVNFCCFSITFFCWGVPGNDLKESRLFINLWTPFNFEDQVVPWRGGTFGVLQLVPNYYCNLLIGLKVSKCAVVSVKHEIEFLCADVCQALIWTGFKIWTRWWST